MTNEQKQDRKYTISDCKDLFYLIGSNKVLDVLCLNERDRNIFKQRYLFNKEYEQIGIENEITKERVRQILLRATRKIREKLESYSEKIYEIEKLHGIIANQSTQIEYLKSKVPDMNLDAAGWRMIEIEDLDLSVRCYNCLKAGRINYLGQLLDYTSRELLCFRNFGKKSLDEVERLRIKYKGI